MIDILPTAVFVLVSSTLVYVTYSLLVFGDSDSEPSLWLRILASTSLERETRKRLFEEFKISSRSTTLLFV